MKLEEIKNKTKEATWSAGKSKPYEEITRENGEEKNPQAQLYGFRAVYVFDISQTERKDLPALTEVKGDVGGYRERLVKFVEAQSIELRYSDKIGPAKGLSYEGKITLLSGMQPPEEFSTLVHEIGHLCCRQHKATKCCTGENAAPSPPNLSARPKPKPWLSWCAKPSDSKTEPPPLIMLAWELCDVQPCRPRPVHIWRCQTSHKLVRVGPRRPAGQCCRAIASVFRWPRTS
jgi:hypothetical protein